MVRRTSFWTVLDLARASPGKSKSLHHPAHPCTTLHKRCPRLPGHGTSNPNHPRALPKVAQTCPRLPGPCPSLQQLARTLPTLATACTGLAHACTNLPGPCPRLCPRLHGTCPCLRHLARTLPSLSPHSAIPEIPRVPRTGVFFNERTRLTSHPFFPHVARASPMLCHTLLGPCPSLAHSTLPALAMSLPKGLRCAPWSLHTRTRNVPTCQVQSAKCKVLSASASASASAKARNAREGA